MRKQCSFLPLIIIMATLFVIGQMRITSSGTYSSPSVTPSIGVTYSSPSIASDELMLEDASHASAWAEIMADRPMISDGRYTK